MLVSAPTATPPSLMANVTPILRLRELMELTGRKRSSIYEDMDAGRMPRPIKLGPRAVGWLLSEIEQWHAVRVEARAADAAAREADRFYLVGATE